MQSFQLSKFDGFEADPFVLPPPPTPPVLSSAQPSYLVSLPPPPPPPVFLSSSSVEQNAVTPPLSFDTDSSSRHITFDRAVSNDPEPLTHTVNHLLGQENDLSGFVNRSLK